MIRQISIMDAIHSLKPEYTSSPIIIYTEDQNVDSSGTTIDWGGATPISNSDITTEQTRLQNLETNCYHPRRVGTATTDQCEIRTMCPGAGQRSDRNLFPEVSAESTV